MQGIKYTTESFIEKAKEIHKEKYTYENVVYKHSNQKVLVTCPIHGDFLTLAKCLLQGWGCPKCKAEAQRKRRMSNTEQFIKSAIAVHGDKYDYSLVDYVSSKKKVKIICPSHGCYEIAPNSHLCGCGCTSCAKPGFDKNQLATIYVLCVNGIFSFTGFGITNDFSKREISHNRNLARSGCFIENLFVTNPMQGIVAYNLEQCLKQRFPRQTITIPISGFRQENTTASFQEVVTFVQNYIEQNKEPQQYGDTRLN